jgi:hypothetical protein
VKHILEREDFSNYKLDWHSIKFVKLDSEGTLMNLGVILPGEDIPNPKIVLTLQVIHDYLYQPHITIDEELRGRGLSTKIYRALIEKLGHLYSGKGRRQNKIMDKVWDRLSHDNTISCAKSSIGDACWTQDNPDGAAIRNFING